jgi:PAS domain S-box-containing protein
MATFEKRRHRPLYCRVIQAMRLQTLSSDRLLESIRDAVVVADARTGRIVLWNAAATRIFGYSSSEALEQSWTVIVPERLKAQCEAGMARYRDTGHGPYIDSHIVLELPAVRKDNEEITIEIALSPISLSHNAKNRRRLVLAIIRDVTERKQAETRAREVEYRYRALVENIPAIVYIEDVETQATLYDSPQIETVLGYPADTCEKVPHYWEKILHPDDRERVMAAEILATERGEFKLEYRVLASDGRLVWLRDDATIIRDQEGRPRFWQGVIFDITERKRTEEEVSRLNESLEQRVAERTVRLQAALTELGERERGLRESEQLYRSVVEQAAENIFLVDTETKQILEANAAFHKSLGYTLQELLQMTLYDIVAHDRESVDDNVRRILKEGHHFIGERRYRRKDSSLADVEVSVSVIPYRGREAFCVVAHDITERKQAEEALKESERRFRQLFENSVDALFVHDEQGRFVDCNTEACRALGYSREELAELSVADIATHLISEEERREKKGDTLWERALRGEPGRIVGIEQNELVRKDGSSFPVEVGVGAIEYGGRRMIFASARDISERKRAEEEIQRLNEELERRVRRRTAQLEAFNRELEAFSYSVSHDLRAPLRAIDGFSQILLEDHEDALNEEGQSHLRRVRAASQRMGQLIDDLLDLSRMTRGQMRRERVDLSALAQSIAEEFRRTQPEHEVEVIIEEGLVANGDGSLLRVMLENLLGNAWKFTKDQPHPSIEFGLTEYGDDRAYYVRDNGVGFDMAYADKLFGAFQRLHSVSEYEGTGIGLTTVQRIIHRHGGQVWAKSEVGKGTTFFFTLSRAAPGL